MAYINGNEVNDAIIVKRLNAPTGTIEITENGEYDVAEYGTANVNVVPSRLPAEYQEVEYIEATGTQYIDTGLTAADYDTYLIEGNFTDLSTAQCMLAYSISGTYTSGWFGAFDNKFNFAPIGTTTWTANGGSNTNNHKFKWSYQNRTAFVDSTRLYLNASGTKNNTANHYLFARHDTDGSDAPNLFCKFRMRSAKFFNDNLDLVGDFVPCYRKADNEIGKYDIVRNQFFTNQGTGVFLKGADI